MIDRSNSGSNRSSSNNNVRGFVGRRTDEKTEIRSGTRRVIISGTRRLHWGHSKTGPIFH